MTDLRDQLAAFEDAARRLPVRTGTAVIRLRSGRHLGPMLRRIRLDLGLTLDTVGERAHITRKGVCNRELHGVALPAAALIEHLDALGYDVHAVRRPTPKEDA